MSSGQNGRYSNIAKNPIYNESSDARWKKRIIKKLELLLCDIKNHKFEPRERRDSFDSNASTEHHSDRSDSPTRKRKRIEDFDSARMSLGEQQWISTGSVEQINVIPDQAGPSNITHYTSNLFDESLNDIVTEEFKAEESYNGRDVICEALVARGIAADRILAMRDKYAPATWALFIGRFKKWSNYCMGKKIHHFHPKIEDLRNFMLQEWIAGANKDGLSRYKSALRIVFPEIDYDPGIKRAIDAAPPSRNSSGK